MASRMIALFTLIVALVSVTNTAHAQQTPHGYFTAESAYVASNGMWMTEGTVTYVNGTTMRIKIENRNASDMVAMPVYFSDGFIHYMDGSEDSSDYVILDLARSYTIALPLITN